MKKCDPSQENNAIRVRERMSSESFGFQGHAYPDMQDCDPSQRKECEQSHEKSLKECNQSQGKKSQPRMLPVNVPVTSLIRISSH